MKAVLAVRQTQCSHCKKPIIKGAQRLDDMARIDDRIVRFHYHRECFNERIEEYFEHAEVSGDKVNVVNRPMLKDILSPEQLTHRHKLLARLSSLKGYYIPKLNFSTDPDALTRDDLIRFKNFTSRRQAILAELETVGGIPPNHVKERQLDQSEDTQTIMVMSAFLALN